MKILYIGVHSHIGWGAEYWLEKAFADCQIELEIIDYRNERESMANSELKNYIFQKSSECDLLFLQRGDKLSPEIFNNIKIPIIFWSTEPIQLKTDVDELLQSDIFSWVYVHSYSCLDRIKSDFNHLSNITSVMHNAAPRDIIDFSNNKSTYAIFNRNLSIRRRYWLWPSRKMITKISGRYGKDYFGDLRNATIAVNIHFSKKNLDDFESGIFEAMASGCVVISERLYYKTIDDLGMSDAIIQFDTPRELRDKLKYLQLNLDVLTNYLEKSKLAIQKNTWHDRVVKMHTKFLEVCN